jgi:hypothetical protein
MTCLSTVSYLLAKLPLLASDITTIIKYFSTGQLNCVRVQAPCIITVPYQKLTSTFGSGELLLSSHIKKFKC